MVQLSFAAPQAYIRAIVEVPEAWVCRWDEIDDGNIRWLDLPITVAIELGAQRLEVDLRGVEFLDGAVMKALCRASRSLSVEEKAVRVRVQPRVAILFRRVHLDRILTIRTDGPEESTHGNIEDPAVRQ